MCTFVYIGSDLPIPIDPPAVDGAVAPAPIATKPPLLESCRYSAALVSWYDGKPTCSCVFNEKSLPWEAIEEEPETIAAFDTLRALAQKHAGGLRIFGCEYADHTLSPNVTCKVAPEHIRAGMILFNIPFGGGFAPRISVEVVPGLKQPEKPETLGVL